VDSGVEEGQEISINYDPLLTKLCTWGSTRGQAIDRMKRALAEYTIEGCKTTIPFCHFVMEHPAFLEAHYDTHFIKDHFHPDENNPQATQTLNQALHQPVPEDIRALAAVLLNQQTVPELQRPDLSNPLISDTTPWWLNRK
jgi:propionyl-CoA carboxylase alpha chain